MKIFKKLNKTDYSCVVYISIPFAYKNIQLLKRLKFSVAYQVALNVIFFCCLFIKNKLNSECFILLVSDMLTVEKAYSDTLGTDSAIRNHILTENQC